mmetsp:Transcript_25211/g.59775  ORF Transcript_25211/g.59775 Transcript_25211/m.59775 type:complete len:161 (-) Transcript_25211:338-820(-)
MGASDSTARGGEQANFLGCCEARGKNVHQLAREPSVRLCGVGMGLDSQLLAAGRGAVVTCLAKGGPAEQGGAVRIGDAVVYVDSLDVRELMNNPDTSKYDVSRGVSTVLANALLGEPGSTVRLGLIRNGESKVVYRDLARAPLAQGCQWISATADSPPPP